MLVDHPNIIRLYETYEDELYLHLVMELCTGGDVCERILEKKSFCEKEAADLLKKLLTAVQYLHSNNITHRDLKPENFLYESKNSNEIKICDFGLSIICDRRERMKTVVGTPYFVAPEIFSGSYSKEVDIWSLGVFLYFLLLGKYPFTGNTLEEVLEKSKNGYRELQLEKETKISDLAKDLIKKMLVLQPSRRMSIKNAMSHPWFKENPTSYEKISKSVFKSLGKYKSKSKLWQEAIKIIINYLSLPQIASLKKAFLAIDASNYGYITAEDLRISMKESGFTLASEEISKIIQNCTYLTNGKIYYSDFLVATLDKKELMNEEVMWEAFKVFDYHNRGKVYKSDLKDALKRARCYVCDEEFEVMIQGANIDQEDGICFKDFTSIMANFEEEQDIFCGNTRKMSLIKRITTDFQSQLRTAQTLPSIHSEIN